MTIAALAGLLLVWLIAVRVPEPAPVKPVVHAPPPVRTVAPPATESVAAKPEDVPVKPTVAETETKPPEPAKAPESPAPAATETASEDTSTDDDSATDADTDDSGPPAIDVDHATDLLADMIAREEATTDGDHLPNPSVQTLKKFDQESSDDNWSANAEQHIEATLDAWIAAMPGDGQSHLALIHVECRTTLCQVLAADNDPGTSDERAGTGHEWQQAIASLPQQPWWHELGFVDLNTQVKPADDHILYMSYLLREAKAPPADAPSDGGGDDGNVDGG